MDGWNQHQHDTISFKLVALELHNNCSYIVPIELHVTYIYSLTYNELHPL
jgi:hypothetical protein